MWCNSIRTHSLQVGLAQVGRRRYFENGTVSNFPYLLFLFPIYLTHFWIFLDQLYLLLLFRVVQWTKIRSYLLAPCCSFLTSMVLHSYGPCTLYTCAGKQACFSWDLRSAPCAEWHGGQSPIPKSVLHWIQTYDNLAGSNSSNIFPKIVH